MGRVLIAGLLLLLASSLSSPAHGQQHPQRIGFGLTTTVTTDFAEPVGLGLHVRWAYPVNSDLSFAAHGGFAGFVLGGRDNAKWYATPQALAILTLQAGNPGSPYVMLGVGGYLDLGGSNDASEEGGPTLSGGIGWAYQLRNTSVYVEIAPALVIGREASRVILPLRVGVMM